MTEQVLIYEIKSSAKDNANTLLNKPKNLFYWNQEKFKKLNLGDFVFVVNTHSSWVLFSKLDKKKIQVSIDHSNQSTSFVDEGIKYKVDGIWEDFVRFSIIDFLNTPTNWPWKSLGSSETTYINGESINKNTAGNRVINIEQLKQLSNNKYFTEVLNNCQMNFQVASEKFAPWLHKFFDQAKTKNLKTSSYPKHYRDTKVKVSFGQGYAARIPWISFLIPPFKTSNGLYPVYLYYQEIERLVLAYGISETHKPDLKWDIPKNPTISSFFKQNKWPLPDRYGDSFVFKVYDVGDLPSDDQLDNDLEEIISEYKMNIAESEINELKVEPFRISQFYEACSEAGLYYSYTLTTRFVSSLLTKPFVILTGLSGSGKTKMAQAFVQWICQSASLYRIIPVGADWTNREPLLGYPNALKPEEYVKPDSGVLDLIIQANKEPDLPHFLILDEMNLSHVERYFADFLSVMESKEEIPLYAEGTVENGVPAKLKLPSNFFIIGTVNIDETTNMFSPKVLDRANTIEFRVTQDEMKNFLGNIKDVNMASVTGKGAGMAKSFLDMSVNKSFTTVDVDTINNALVQFFGELKKTGAEFGYRSATEILRLIHQLSVLDSSLTTNQKIDIAIMQKLLPKLHGSRRKLSPVLETLGSFCTTDNVKVINDVFDKPDFDFNAPNVLYPLSLEKIARMYRGAIDNGFASYAEA